MANTIAQNCQRGIIFLTFLTVLLYFVITVVSLIKKKIDTLNESAGDSKYQEGEKKQSTVEESGQSFDHAAIQATKINDDDDNVTKVIKRVNEFKMSYFSMLIIIPLNILTGTSKAFSLVFYLFILAVVLIINVAKLHRKCFDHKCILVILENIWIFMLFFELLNIWSTSTILQPYIVVRG